MKTEKPHESSLGFSETLVKTRVHRHGENRGVFAPGEGPAAPSSLTTSRGGRLGGHGEAKWQTGPAAAAFPPPGIPWARPPHGRWPGVRCKDGRTLLSAATPVLLAERGGLQSHRGNR